MNGIIDEKKTKVIAVMNQKGGCAKTATVINLAMGLARAHKKVLAIDCDPQGSMTRGFGIREEDDLEYTIKNVFEDVVNGEDLSIFKEHIIEHDEDGAKIELLPANISLAGVEQFLVVQMGRETVLRDFIDTIRGEYDYILLDCNPSLGLINMNAIIACDEMIIPVEAEDACANGLKQLLATVRRCKRGYNKKLKIKGILFTLVKSNVNLHAEIMREVTDIFGGNIRIFNSVIPNTIKVAESNHAGVSIYKYRKNNMAAIAYEEFTEEVLEDE